MVFLLIAGVSFMTRSAFQAGFLQGAAAEGAEIAVPYFAPHFAGGSFLTVLAIFFGGMLLIKLISAIVGMIMFRRWKKEMGDKWEDMGPSHYRKFRRGPWGYWHHGPWGYYPIKRDPEAESEDSESEPDPES